MQKVVFFIPLMFSLVGCGSSKPAVTDETELAPGIMQPVSGSGASDGSYSWPSEIESVPMPSSMTK